MARLPDLEDFECTRASGQPLMVDAEAVEDMRMDSFARGYAEGREEAQANAQEAAERSRNAAFASLQDLSLTYKQAHDHVLRATLPVLQTICAAVLPGMARATLAPTIAEMLAEHVAAAQPAAIHLRTHPGNCAAIRCLSQRIPNAATMHIIGDPALGPGQAHLCLDEREMQIDLDAVCAGVERALDEFITNREDTANDREEGP